MEPHEAQQGRRPLACEPKAISDLQAALASAQEEGISSGKLYVIFELAQLLEKLADEFGYKVVLMRKDTLKLPLDTNLFDIGLSTRVANVLFNWGGLTLGDVLKPDKFLLDLNGFGPAALRELDEALARAGYQRPQE